MNDSPKNTPPKKSFVTDYNDDKFIVVNLVNMQVVGDICQYADQARDRAMDLSISGGKYASFQIDGTYEYK